MSLTLGWFLGRAADLTNIKRGRLRDVDGVDFPVNAEHPEQRAALLAALAPLGTDAGLQAIASKLIAAPASEAKVEAVRALLASTLAVLPVIKAWAPWAPATAIDMRNYAGVEIQVTAAGTAIFTRSADDATYAPISATASGVAAASPLALGFYSLKGGGYLKFAGAATILIRGYN